MPYEPTFPQPYLKAIDASLSSGNNFQCVINPRDKISSYILTISKASDGTEVFHVIGEHTGTGVFKKYYQIGSSTRVEIPTIPPQDTKLPLQGKANSDESTLVINVPKTIVLSNGDEYVWKIKLTDTAGNSSTSRDYYFATATTPVVSFSVPENVYTSRIDITATYSQLEKLTPAYYRFDLYTGANIVYSTDDIFSADIQFSYDKLINGKSYTLELIVTLDNGMEIMESADFNVSYAEINTLVAPTATVNNRDGYVTVDFSNSANIKGIIEGDESSVSFAKAYNAEDEVPDSENIARLSGNTSIYWNKSNTDPLDLENASHFIHLHLHKPFGGKIFEKIDELNPLRNISIYFKDGQFYYNIGMGETEYHNVYSYTANAIAGRDDYSAKGVITGWSIDTNTLDVPPFSKTKTMLNLDITKTSAMTIKAGMIISTDKFTTTISDAGSGYVILDGSYSVSEGDIVSIYRTDCLYILHESDEIAEDDILISHELTPDNWYYLYITNDKVEFIEDTNNIIIEEVS